MKQQDIFKIYNDCIISTYIKMPLVFVKGKGSYLWDIHNRRYLDFFPGWGVGNLGHCHPKIMSAVRDQVSKLIFVPNNYYHIPQARLAEELSRLSGFSAKIFFCNSGAEANEAAIKLARKFGKGRFEIITFLNSFHGRTLAALAATGQDKYKDGFQPLPKGFLSVPFNDLEAVRRATTDRTVAIMIELIQGEGGINVADSEFISGLRRFCDERRLLLIIDEVQTGIGRTGKFLAYQHYGIIPDVVTLAKSLGGGLPIGAMLVRRELANVLGQGSHASTFGGGCVVCKAALAVLRTIQRDKLLVNAKNLGEYLLAQLNSLRDKYQIIDDIRGKGLMIGIELKAKAREVVEECVKRGLLINCTHERVLRVMPALNVNKKQVDQAIAILDEVLGLFI